LVYLTKFCCADNPCLENIGTASAVFAGGEPARFAGDWQGTWQGAEINIYQVDKLIKPEGEAMMAGLSASAPQP
jgi:hypothetical protein